MPVSFVAVELKTSVYTKKQTIPEGSFAENCSDHQPEKGRQAPESESSFVENCIDHRLEKGLQALECHSFLAGVWPENR